MKNRFILISMVIMGCIYNLKAQTKVLFLGNSFTSYYYSVPSHFNSFATEAGIPVFVDYRSPGGYQIANHITDATTQAKIVSKKWDYVVVQENLGNLAGEVGYVSTTCLNAHQTLINQIKANDSCTRIVFFAGWGPKGGTSGSDNTNACINRIHDNYILLNNYLVDEIVSPIGKSWITCMSQIPAWSLYYSDNLHASDAGAYITAATIFTTIFKMNLTNVNYDSYIGSTDAQAMRTIAFNSVTNATYFTTTNLSSYTPVININGATLTCSGTYSSYQWYFNGNPVGSNSNTYTAVSSGNYYIIVTNSSGCPLKSFDVSVTASEIAPIINEFSFFSLMPTGENVFELNSKLTGTVSVFDIQGKQIISLKKETGKSYINLNNAPKGLYFIRLLSGNIQYSKKVSVNQN